MFCADKNVSMDYKDAKLMNRFVTERGKILPRRTTGVCAKHQRALTKDLKRARVMAMVPYTD